MEHLLLEHLKFTIHDTQNAGASDYYDFHKTISQSENTVQFNRETYNEIRKWALDNNKERCAILFANQAENVISPTRFVTSEILTEKSHRSKCLDDIDAHVCMIYNSADNENVVIMLHNHCGLLASANQSSLDKKAFNWWQEYLAQLKNECNMFIDKTILMGIATASCIGVYELDKQGVSNRLEIKVGEKRKHPSQFCPDFVKNMCAAVSAKINAAKPSVKAHIEK